MRSTSSFSGLFGIIVTITVVIIQIIRIQSTSAFLVNKINNEKGCNTNNIITTTTSTRSSSVVVVQQRRQRRRQTNNNFQLFPSGRIIKQQLKASRQQSDTTTTSSETDKDASDKDTVEVNGSSSKPYKHGLAILTMPSTSLDKIANEAILQTILQKTWKLSVYLKSTDDNDNENNNNNKQPSLSSLRRYIGEIYSTLWDFCSESEELEDVVVYAQNLPNCAPEQWIHHLDDLDCICSHDTIVGWEPEETYGRGTVIMESFSDVAKGGLDEHVNAVNDDRISRNLNPVVPLHVNHWPAGASQRFNDDHNVVFLDDDALEDGILQRKRKKDLEEEEDDDGIIEQGSSTTASSFLGGARIPSKALFTSVAVGGTFDGMHYGHRKLLTLAVSSVTPQTGKLLIGVTVDEMLQQKKYAEYIPTLKERCTDVQKFIYRLAPGLKNRIRIVPITNKFGPPGSLPDPENGDTWNNDFDALVLSHETLQTGHELNLYRQQQLGLPPLVLLCTRRTEAIGMSSTTLRKIRNDRRKNENE